PDGTWIQISRGPVWSDQPINGVGGGWNQPQYYTTIQSADIDGDGQAELLARGASGIEVWKFVPGQNYPPDSTWTQMSGGPDWSDTVGWNLPQYYQTIQCADIDGNGQGTLCELLGQGPDGMEMWAFDWRPDSPTHNTWIKGANVWSAEGNFT